MRLAVFDGDDYQPENDAARLAGQILRVFSCMSDGVWRTLGEIQQETKDPQASISAQLRHLRKPRFGCHTIEKRRRGKPRHGLYEYRLIIRNRSARPATIQPDFFRGEHGVVSEKA